MRVTLDRPFPALASSLLAAGLATTSPDLQARDYLVLEGLSYHMENKDSRNALNVG